MNFSHHWRVVSVCSCTMEETKIQNFKKWLSENGANVSKVDFQEFEEGRGCVAKEDIQPGQELCSLP